MTTPEAFLAEVSADRLVVADFFVPWCVACRRFHPALIKLASIHPDCTFLSVRVPLLPEHHVMFCSKITPLCSMGIFVYSSCKMGHPGIPRSLTHPVLLLQVNGAEAGLHEFVASLGVDRLPYFQFYKCGKLLSQFAANLSKIKQVRREIDIYKEQRMRQQAGSAAT